jgi:hypothetical protein
MAGDEEGDLDKEIDTRTVKLEEIVKEKKGETLDYYDKIVRDESADIEDRINAAIKVYKFMDKGFDIPTMYISHIKYDTKTLKDIIDKGSYVNDLDEVLTKASYNYQIEKSKEELVKGDISSVAKKYLSGELTDEERVIAERVLSERKEEAEAVVRATELLKADYTKRRMSAITDPNQMDYGSPEQVKAIDRPVKRYAKDMFRNGMWNAKWGDPFQYKINVVNDMRYVKVPQNLDFVRLMLSLNLWDDRWGDPSKYGVK